MKKFDLFNTLVKAYGLTEKVNTFPRLNLKLDYPRFHS